MKNDGNIEVKPTVLTREYDAPRELVFDAWTKTEHLCNWQFPFKGFTCEFAYADIRPGGSSLHKMAAPNGFEQWLLTEYDEIAPPERLVFRQYLSNEAGEILENPQMPDWPKDMRTTVLLEEAGNKTKLQLIWEPVNPTQQEADTFDATREDHSKGWGGGLDQLVDYLDTLQKQA